jgi:hypothetical protein
MKKPKKPVKPKKNSPKPQRSEWLECEFLEDRHNERFVIMTNEELIELAKTKYPEGWNDFMNDMGDDCNPIYCALNLLFEYGAMTRVDKLNSNRIEYLQSSIKKRDHFKDYTLKICPDVEWGAPLYLEIEILVEKDEDTYNKEVAAWESRFDTYEKQLKEYEKQLAKYEEWKKEEKKKKLQEELAKLS